MVIEEGVIPGGMSTVLAHVFGLTPKLIGKGTDDGVADHCESGLASSRA
jgi:hypothetical protein